MKIKTHKIPVQDDAINDDLDAGLEHENILAIEQDDAGSEPPGDNDLQQLLIILWNKWGADFPFVWPMCYLSVILLFPLKQKICIK